ncbi:hypothetical protein DENSPDRAFT_841092 [Dentipellis sp. KUC8613]|nr:hypothetical protein DENSPDRAFT_841092 [Dentipellis sp. KUC8613]
MYGEAANDLWLGSSQCLIPEGGWDAHLQQTLSPDSPVLPSRSLSPPRPSCANPLNLSIAPPLPSASFESLPLSTPSSASFSNLSTPTFGGFEPQVHVQNGQASEPAMTHRAPKRGRDEVEDYSRPAKKSRVDIAVSETVEHCQTVKRVRDDGDDDEDDEYQPPAKKSRADEGSLQHARPKYNKPRRSVHDTESPVRRVTPVALQNPQLKAVHHQTGDKLQPNTDSYSLTGELEGPEDATFDPTPETNLSPAPEVTYSCSQCVGSKFAGKSSYDRHMQTAAEHSQGVDCPMSKHGSGCGHHSKCCRADSMLRHLDKHHPRWRDVLVWEDVKRMMREAARRGRKGVEQKAHSVATR